MLKHADIWAAIDRLAKLNGLSASGLARRSGLDPTTFNPSKRQSSDGKLRWPSTESISKILDATGSSMAAFVRLIDDGSGLPARRIPIVSRAQAAANGLFDEAGRPAGKGWDEVDFPNLSDPTAYALEIAGTDMAPIYRDGDVMSSRRQPGCGAATGWWRGRSAAIFWSASWCGSAPIGSI